MFRVKAIGDISKVMQGSKQDLKVEVANSTRANFWPDRWSEFSPLGEKFPWIFSLSTKKEGKMTEFDDIDFHSVNWNLHLGRSLRDEEIWSFRPSATY